VFTPTCSLRSVLRTTFVAGLSLAVGLHELPAQTDTGGVQIPHDIRRTADGVAERYKIEPFNFTGRVFVQDVIGFGTATLIRRHTALTAAHIVFDPTLGFVTNATWTRARYKNSGINFRLSTNQVASVGALSGYQTAAVTAAATPTSTAIVNAFARDQGYLLFTEPPVDENWGNYTTDTSLFTDDSARYILGYPGDSPFNGQTMAYIVPMTAFAQTGKGNTGSFVNEDFIATSGFSGGPLYALPTTGALAGQQVIIGDLVGGNSDTTGEFTQSFVRAITPESGKFLAAPEYASGLISSVPITGPTTVAPGQTATYTATVTFSTKTLAGDIMTTDRYMELKLKSDAVGTPTNPAVVIKKLSNTEFQVTFSKSLRSGSKLNLFTIFAKNSPAPNSTLAITIK
jgi:V8-like Glu-specific endopeptidase